MGVFAFWPVSGNRTYWGIFDHLFSDTCNKGLESEITRFAGRKTGLIIPFWLADRRSDGLEKAENGKKGCFECLDYFAQQTQYDQTYSSNKEQQS